MCWEKMINFVFSSRAMTKEVDASFSLYWKEARADFLFQREKRIFWHFLIAFESLWRSRWIFLGSIEQQKRDFTSEIWASRIIMKTKILWKQKLKSWIVGKARAEKNYWVNSVSSALWKMIVGNLWISRWAKSIFFVHSDVHVETSWASQFKKFNVFSCKFLKILWNPVSVHMNISMNKKYWFSQWEIHKLPTIIFHSAEAEIFGELANHHLAIPGLSSIKIFFWFSLWMKKLVEESRTGFSCQIDAIFGN